MDGFTDVERTLAALIPYSSRFDVKKQRDRNLAITFSTVFNLSKL